jgi:hypothetical protein
MRGRVAFVGPCRAFARGASVRRGPPSASLRLAPPPTRGVGGWRQYSPSTRRNGGTGIGAPDVMRGSVSVCAAMSVVQGFCAWRLGPARPPFHLASLGNFPAAWGCSGVVRLSRLARQIERLFGESGGGFPGEQRVSPVLRTLRMSTVEEAARREDWCLSMRRPARRQRRRVRSSAFSPRRPRLLLGPPRFTLAAPPSPSSCRTKPERSGGADPATVLDFKPHIPDRRACRFSRVRLPS